MLVRHSLHDQAAKFLRDGIRKGRWRGELPSESALCRELQISRATLRHALAQLARERWIRLGGRGRHHRIVRLFRGRPGARGKVVRMLTPLGRSQINATSQSVHNEIQERLNAAGYRVELEHHPAVYRRRPAQELARLAALPDTAGWILFLTTRAIQEWFAASGLPCVVTGAVYPGVPLANVEFDLRAACQHAAAQLLGRGHRELVFITPNHMTAGDQASLEGFLEGARPHGRAAQARLVNFDGTPAGLGHALDRVLGSEPRPTGFLVGYPEHTLGVIGHLQRRGLRVPGDAAVVSRFHDVYLGFAVPSVARYRVADQRMGRNAAEILLDLIAHGPGKRRSHRLMPEFIPGETLGQ